MDGLEGKGEGGVGLVAIGKEALDGRNSALLV
jgi:hypothetical protein